ncbi:MAG: hypothetical protein WBA87_09275 [Microbacterium sp.]
MNTQTCHICDDTFAGTRSEARSAMWEPYSSLTQRALDEGPMVCSSCVERVLDDLLAVMHRAWR